MEDALTATRNWLESFVVELNLCPFAGYELKNNRVRLVTFDGNNEEALLEALRAEIEFLDGHPATETTFLVHPHVLQEFNDYNQFLNLADDLLVTEDREGIYQIASFHPQYQFAGTDRNAAENFTNRSPFPMLHLLRETSVEKAIQNHPDVERIPENNIERMNAIGTAKLASLLRNFTQLVDE